MDDIRDKEDRDLTPNFPDVEKSPDVDYESPEKDGGCPTCGTKDVQSAELLEAWKELEELRKRLVVETPVVACREDGTPIPYGDRSLSANTEPKIDWKHRYEKIKTAYVKTRLEVSGSFGNWDYNTRKRILENEISSELGFTV